MASMAATCRFTVKGFESRSLCPRSSSLHPQFHSLSTYRRSCSTDSLRTSKNAGLLRIRAMCSDSSGPGPQLEDTVKNTIAQNPVVVYSKTWCSYSSEVKSLFKRVGAEPFVIELDRLVFSAVTLKDLGADAWCYLVASGTYKSSISLV